MMRLRRPSVFAIALTLMGVAVFSTLGIWQLNRASFKETVLARFHDAAGAPPIPFSDAAIGNTIDRYPHLEVHGHLDGKHVYLLDNQMRHGRLGDMVFVPFQPDGGSRVLLVNLGFLPKPGGIATAAPEIPPIPDHEVTLTGIYAPPPLPGLKLGGNPLVREKTWPKLVTFIDMDQIGADLRQQVLPHVLLLDPDPHSAYLRLWTANIMLPARHRAYALQWFSFAVAAVVMFFVLHRVRRDDPSTKPRD